MKIRPLPCHASVVLGLLLLLLTGCAGKLPGTTPLNEVEGPKARQLFHDFLNRECPTALDADVSLRWHNSLKQITYSAIIQAQAPGLLNFRIVDPLGRPLFLVGIDGISFTIVDIGKAEAWLSEQSSAYLNDFLPETVVGKNLFGWLIGRPDTGCVTLVKVEREQESPCLWYSLDYRDGLTHHVRFEPQQGRVLRHLVMTGKKEILLDATYRYQGEPGVTTCNLPTEVVITGSRLKGEVTLAFTRIYSTQPLEDETFQITIPDHFTIHGLE